MTGNYSRKAVVTQGKYCESCKVGMLVCATDGLRLLLKVSDNITAGMPTETNLFVWFCFVWSQLSFDVWYWFQDRSNLSHCEKCEGVHC